ncbi:MAG: hypothetical protein AAGH79_17150 [Bacteroidota bacterium]
MIIVTILLIILSINLQDVVTERAFECYKDFRFWAVLVSILVVLMVTAQRWIL